MLFQALIFIVHCSCNLITLTSFIVHSIIVLQIYQLHDFVVFNVISFFSNETRSTILNIVIIAFKSHSARDEEITRSTRNFSAKSIIYFFEWVINRSVFQRAFRNFLKIIEIFRQIVYYRFFLFKRGSSASSSFNFSSDSFVYSTEHFSSASNSSRFRIHSFIINRDEIEHRDDTRSISSMSNY